MRLWHKKKKKIGCSKLFRFRSVFVLVVCVIFLGRGLPNRGFQIVPIIEIPGYGQTSAKLMCEKLKIKSCKEADKLKKAKEEVRFIVFWGAGFCTEDVVSQNIIVEIR